MLLLNQANYIENKTIEGDIRLADLVAGAKTAKQQKTHSILHPIIFENCTFTGRLLAYETDEEGDAKLLDHYAPVKFINCTFEDDVTFRQATFRSEFSISGSTFKGKANFEQAKFFHEVNAHSAIFEKEVRFQNAIFMLPANFMQTQYDDIASFQQAEFRSTWLVGNVEFFDYADFSKLTCWNQVVFNYAKFHKKSVFNNAKFFGSVDINKGELANASFKGTKFHDDLNFSENTIYHEIDWSHTYQRIK